MNGYDKITTVLNGSAADPVPTMLHSFMPAAAEKGLNQREYRSNADNIARAHIDFARKYDLDGILVDVDTCMEAGAIGIEVDLPDNEPARVTKGLSTDLDLCIEAMDKDSLLKYDRINIMLDAIFKMRKEVGGELLIRGNADQGPFSLAMLSMGISEFLMALLDEDSTGKIKLLLDRALELHLEYHRLIKEAGADITSFGDSSCGPDLISPAMYREFSLPWHKEIVRRLDAQNITTVCHICGNLDLILEDVVSAGFAAVEVDYKTDIARAAEIMKGKSVLFGPIDPSGTFYFGSPKEVEKITKDVLRLFPEGGLVIGAGCALPQGVGEDNIRAFCRAVSS
ncbi:MULTISPECIES: uroporphyrinogen decarboxylase family protein [unclassified Oceanispirochaeta]|uniref:uroporphyrinogen decarboxylase family protein n=1 Tax=unclassified Oceanispirochaeta TaxID=2635722 RepID=UPI001314DE00|nr:MULTISPECIES: uroporphyrinogen decarboxylase family protein [unclassified Oceanispirochaeta]MBF9017293.1 uroporphyrinogen decarboxylase family protein [Oceanispirochaeta sp. M2]NPD73803.1 hypothetical protein [Oceanispirochaeta sp. M1]